MTKPLLLPERLAEIKKRCDAATPGPWDYESGTATIWGPGDELIVRGWSSGSMQGPNWTFIAHAWEDVAALCDEIDRLNLEREEWPNEMI